MVMSAVSGIIVLMPMVYIHRIVNNLILNGTVNFDYVKENSIHAAAFAGIGLFIYLIGLILSHIFAFEVEDNIIKTSVTKLRASSTSCGMVSPQARSTTCTSPPSTAYPKSRISKSEDSAYLYAPHFVISTLLNVSKSKDNVFIICPFLPKTARIAPRRHRHYSGSIS